MKFVKIIILSIITLGGIFSCITQKDLVVLREGSDYDSSYVPVYTPYKLQPYDILTINVASTDAESAKLFVKSDAGGGRNGLSEQTSYVNGFTVSDSGIIVIPIIGEVMAKGLTVEELNAVVQSKMNLYFKYAIVDVKIANFRLTFMGEFRQSGPQLIYRNRINLIEALALSGGLNDLAIRDKVKIYRVIDGQTHIRTVDFTSVDLIKHEWFYLMPNDVLYAEPRRIKALQMNLATISFISSVISFGLLIVNLSTRRR